MSELDTRESYARSKRLVQELASQLVREVATHPCPAEFDSTEEQVAATVGLLVAELVGNWGVPGRQLVEEVIGAAELGRAGALGGAVTAAPGTH